LAQSVRRSALRLQRFVERVRARESCERVDIVAHSLGGVVARYYIERMGGAAHVGRLIAIGSPLRGTALGRLIPFVPSTRELSHLSPFIAELGPVQTGVQLTSIWSRADAIVSPPESASVAPVGTDFVFEDIGHLAMIFSPRVVRIVADQLGAELAGTAPA
jgi:triacylglycerol esterase/lipase EstA (alpha/beta hydrolase family)